jgi:hypothetical protein
VPNEDGSIGHAEIRIGDSVVMMFDGRANWPDLPAFLRLYVVNGDAVFARAIDAGAEPVTEMTELAWGDRVGRVRDPQGNVWWIQDRIAGKPAPQNCASIPYGDPLTRRCGTCKRPTWSRRPAEHRSRRISRAVAAPRSERVAPTR